MKYGSIKFTAFLEENGISAYFLHHSIKKEMEEFNKQVLAYESTDASDEALETSYKKLDQKDQEILTAIKEHLIKRIRKKATDDKQILTALKRLKWTKKITEPELRSMGLQASLFWNTTMLGTLKLVRIGDYTPIYYLLSFGDQLVVEQVYESHRILKHKIIEEPV